MNAREGRHTPGIAKVLQYRSTPATGVPKGKNLDALEVFVDAVVHVVANACQVEAAHTNKVRVASCGTHAGLGCDERRGALDRFGDRSWCLRPVETPPRLSGEDLRFGDIG